MPPISSNPLPPDFWTTKCTRCPAALDKLHSLTTNPLYSNYTILSIVCDSLDPAREILHSSKAVKWPNIRHLYTNIDSKEAAKKHYGFNQVPFYVVYEDGEVKEASNKVDFAALVAPKHEEEKKEDREFCMDEDF
ncbi:hypothetical protein TL16_g02690 [Triparma laevis f. inornata]|uniref:Thioredoxin domain-containing protein n=1 Tax=Triparma laevis f. inornata TaxID=1714386 RepID=A0A9W6ZZS1_9STRA|nr:hypothetical protein TL16_g02690 [Triparma laevis f. inornata]